MNRDVTLKGEAFDKAMHLYNASLNVRYDLDELKERIDNKLDLEISDEEKQDIEGQVRYLYTNKA